MQSKNHINPPGVLPNFCHVGTSLRVILLVEAGAMFSAVAARPDLSSALGLLAERSILIQPALLLTILTLCIASPLLQRTNYKPGMAIILLIGIFLPSLFAGMILRILPGADLPDLFQVLIFSLSMSGLSAAYLHLRGKALSPAVTEARLQALQARIRPHFLFNSLNAVLSLVRSDPRRAEHALEDLSELFRVLMRENRELTTLQNEIDLTRAYVGLEQLRLTDRLQVAWHIDKMPAEALIPPLVIQPLIENAIYHGIEPRSEPGEVSLNIYRKQDHVHVVIRNPVADSGASHEGNKIALGNIQERLDLHFDLDATLKAERLGAVFQVHITLPYTRERRRQPPAQAAHR